MKRKKRSQSISDKNASRNYNNNNRNTDSSDGKRHSSSANLSSIQKSSLSSTITKKLEEKTISEVFGSSKHEPEGERRREEVQPLLAAATPDIYEQGIKDKKEELLSAQKHESINPEILVSTKSSTNNGNINSNLNADFSNTNSVIIEKKEEVAVGQEGGKGEREIHPSTVTNNSTEGKEEESVSSIALQYKNINNQKNLEKENIGKDNDTYLLNANPYLSLWQNPAIIWFDMYNKLSRNSARMTERWLNLFLNPWITRERKDNSGNGEKIRR